MQDAHGRYRDTNYTTFQSTFDIIHAELILLAMQRNEGKIPTVTDINIESKKTNNGLIGLGWNNGKINIRVASPLTQLFGRCLLQQRGAHKSKTQKQQFMRELQVVLTIL